MVCKEIVGLVDIYDILLAERKNLLNESWNWQGIKNRTLQQEYTRIELLLMDKFNRALSSRSTVEVEGFVTRLVVDTSFCVQVSKSRPDKPANREIPAVYLRDSY